MAIVIYRTTPTRSRWLSLVAACAVLAALAGCAEGTESDPTGRTWELTELEGSALVEGSLIDLTIADGELSGSAGCNSYFGPATVDVEEGTMTLGPELGATMMACEQAVMDQEQRYLDALVRVTSYQMAAEELILEDANGIAVATFR